MEAVVPTVSIRDLANKASAVIDEVAKSGKPAVVTKRGKPIAKVTPVAALDNERFYGCMKAKVVIKGDVFSTGRKWHA